MGYLASLLVFLTFCMKTLMPLRLMAIASNIVFILYAAFAGVMPVLLLHGALLPLNVLRAVEQYRIFRRIRNVRHERAQIDALMPFMRPLSVKAGTVLFRKGDRSRMMYYVAQGTVRIPEISKDLPPSTLFGEMGLFAPDNLRSASAHTVTDCQLYTISEDDIARLCLREPAFGLFLTRLMVARMMENQTHVTEQYQVHVQRASGHDTNL